MPTTAIGSSDSATDTSASCQRMLSFNATFFPNSSTKVEQYPILLSRYLIATTFTVSSTSAGGTYEIAPGTLATKRRTARADRCVEGGAIPCVIDCCTQYSAISRTDRFSTCFEKTWRISAVLSQSTGTIASA